MCGVVKYGVFQETVKKKKIFSVREREREREMTSYLRRKNKSGVHQQKEKNQYGIWEHLFEHQWMKGWGNRRHLTKDAGTFRNRKKIFLFFSLSLSRREIILVTKSYIIKLHYFDLMFYAFSHTHIHKYVCRRRTSIIRRNNEKLCVSTLSKIKHTYKESQSVIWRNNIINTKSINSLTRTTHDRKTIDLSNLEKTLFRTLMESCSVQIHHRNTDEKE